MSRFCAQDHGCILGCSSCFQQLLPHTVVETAITSSLLHVAIIHRSPPLDPALPEQHPFNKDEVLATGSTAPSSRPTAPSSRSSSGTPLLASVSATTYISRLGPPGSGSVRSSSSARCRSGPPPPTLHRSRPRQSSSFSSLSATGPPHLRSSLPLPHVIATTTDTQM
jgi:hypothetical protein